MGSGERVVATNGSNRLSRGENAIYNNVGMSFGVFLCEQPVCELAMIRPRSLPAARRAENSLEAKPDRGLTLLKFPLFFRRVSGVKARTLGCDTSAPHGFWGATYS